MNTTWLCRFAFVISLACGLHRAVLAQDLPMIIVSSSNRDSILKALRVEMAHDGLSFKKLDRDRALFEMDTGRQPVRGDMVTVIVETTVRFLPVPAGTRLEVSEVLSAAFMTGSERRTPDPRVHWDAYMAILQRTKARLAGIVESPRDSSHN